MNKLLTVLFLSVLSIFVGGSALADGSNRVNNTVIIHTKIECTQNCKGDSLVPPPPPAPPVIAHVQCDNVIPPSPQAFDIDVEFFLENLLRKNSCRSVGYFKVDTEKCQMSIWRWW
jgi:hypothetical protein